MITVRWIGRLAELHELGERYDDLVRRIGDQGVFYERGWIESMQPAYRAGGRQWAFLWAEREGEALALAPLQVQVKSWRALGLRRLFFMGEVSGLMANGVPDFLVAREADRRDCLKAFLDFLHGPARQAWDTLDLGMIDERSPTVPILRELLAGARQFTDSLPTPLIDLQHGYDAYLQALPGKLRRELGRYQRKLEESGEAYAFRCTDSVDAEHLAQVESIHQGRQSKLRAAGRPRISPFDDPDQARAMRQVLDWSGRQGHARHYWLEIGGRVAAFVLCFHRGRTLFPFMMAFDEAFDSYSPTKLLYLYLFEQEAGVHGTQLVDLLPGLNLLKRQFASMLITHRHFQAVNRTRVISRLRAGWMDFGHTVKRAISRH